MGGGFQPHTTRGRGGGGSRRPPQRVHDEHQGTLQQNGSSPQRQQRQQLNDRTDASREYEHQHPDGGNRGTMSRGGGSGRGGARGHGFRPHDARNAGGFATDSPRRP